MLGRSGLWSVLHSRVSINRNYLIHVTSNALFCILDVWLDFIRVVVLSLFSRGINFQCNKRNLQKLYKRRTRQFESHLLREFMHKSVCFCFPLLISGGIVSFPLTSYQLDGVNSKTRQIF